MMPIVSNLFRAAKRLANHRHGTAAVEFAVVLPVALFLYIGTYQVSDAIMTSRHLSSVTRTSIDLLSQQQTSQQATSQPAGSGATTSTQIDAILKGSAMLMAPKATDSLAITLSAVDVVNNAGGVCCTVTVRWSATRNGTLRPCAVPLTPSQDSNAAPFSIPASLLPPSGQPLAQPLYFLIADTAYVYTPIISVPALNIAPSMQRTEYMSPRSIGQVVAAAMPTGDKESGVICY